MRIFITGATGYIGGTITQILIKDGHQVVGLARSEKSAERLKSMGAEVHLGDLTDLESLKQGVAKAEGVIHTGFSVVEWNKLEDAFAQERTAVEAMISALIDTEHPFIYTSGAGVFADTGNKIVDETVPADATGNVGLRIGIEKTVLEATKFNVRSIVIRPGMVYGNGGSAIIHALAGLVHQAGAIHTVGDGSNSWSAIHVEDLADLYISALEKGPNGTIFHAGTEDEVTMYEIASAIANTLKLNGSPVVWPVEQAQGALGPLAKGLASNKRISSARAREILDWNPHRPSLIEEIEKGSYVSVFTNTLA